MRHYTFLKCPYPNRCLGEPEMGNYNCSLVEEQEKYGVVANTSALSWNASCSEGTHPKAVACRECAPGWTTSSDSTCRLCAETNTDIGDPHWLVCSISWISFRI